ncbi:UNVERIFIED_CONTAM: hypothetical protein FKN15_052941 [Acipenser sinensis]
MAGDTTPTTPQNEQFWETTGLPDDVHPGIDVPEIECPLDDRKCSMYNALTQPAEGAVVRGLSTDDSTEDHRNTNTDSPFSTIAIFHQPSSIIISTGLYSGLHYFLVRLEMTLVESRDKCVREAAPVLKTGRKWVAKKAVEDAKAALRIGDIIGQVQHGRGGLGLSSAPPTWHKAAPAQRRKLVVNEVQKQEERMRCIKAISQAKQGEWMRWESVEQRKIGWQDLWSMEQSRISFLIRSTYDVLPSPQNLNLWVGEDPSCPLCSSPATLRHILTGCKVALSQGRFTWRHDQVLRCLALALEDKRNMTNKLPPVPSKHYTQKTTFLCPGEQPPRKGVKTNPRPGQLEAARDWKMLADVGQIFPPEIATTNFRSDIVLWSGSARLVHLVELTVPWEDAVDEAYERKKLRYAQLATEAEQRGWRVRVYPVEVGCRGFVAHSTTRFLRDVGFSGQELRRTVRNLSEAAERSSNWLWLRQKDSGWGSQVQ